LVSHVGKELTPKISFRLSITIISANKFSPEAGAETAISRICVSLSENLRKMAWAAAP
jgi:hypothetical protein